MKRTISAGDARKRLGELLEGVYYRGDEVVIERAGKPMAVVIPAERYSRIEQGRDRFLDLMDEAQANNKDATYEDTMADIEAAIEEVRSEARRTR